MTMVSLMLRGERLVNEFNAVTYNYIMVNVCYILATFNDCKLVFINTTTGASVLLRLYLVELHYGMG